MRDSEVLEALELSRLRKRYRVVLFTRVVATALLGAALGLPPAIALQRAAGVAPGDLMPALVVALIEEPAKVLGVVWVLFRPGVRLRMDGVIYGAAAGMGFAAFETALYSLARINSVGVLLDVLWLRALLAPFSHGTWTAIVCATIWSERFAGWRRGCPRILAALGVVVLLHTFWDWRPLPLPWNFVWLVAVAGTSVVALRLVLRHANAASAVPCALRSAAKYPPNLRTLRNSAAKYRVFACAARGHTLPGMKGELDVEVVLPVRARVGEGPVWDERSNTLVWVDIMNNSVHVFDPASGHDRAVDVGQPVGAAALRERGGLVLALRDGFAVMNADLDDLRWVARVEEDVPTNRMNDGKCDAAGRFWAGSMAFAYTPGVASLYRLDPDYRVTRVLADVTLSNGLDWAADNRRMYYIDSPTQRVDVFDFDLERGLLGERRTAIAVPREVGLPDGMTIDAEGYLWVALHGSGTVRRYSPDGLLDRVVRVPAKQVTCCAFGGADYGDLYITSMADELSPEAVHEQPLAGALFRTRPGVRGRPGFRFRG